MQLSMLARKEKISKSNNADNKPLRNNPGVAGTADAGSVCEAVGEDEQERLH
jgi:hypothetical protein